MVVYRTLLLLESMICAQIVYVTCSRYGTEY